MFNLVTFLLQIFLIWVKIWIFLNDSNSNNNKIKIREKMSSCHIDFQHGDGKTLFSQHTNVHNSCCGNYAFMAEKKNITSVIQHPVMLWLEKIFLHGKSTTKHLQYNCLPLWHWKHTVKTDDGLRPTRSKALRAGLTTTDTEGTGDTVNSHIKESDNHFLI